MDKEVDCLMESQKTFRTDLNVLEDRVMDVEMSARHWGRGALETAENILRTLQDVVQISCNVTA
jgi:hypothetical protein